MLNHMVFEDPTVSKPIALLVSERDFQSGALEEHFVEPLVQLGIPKKDIIAITLQHDKKQKITMTAAREYLKNLYPLLDSVSATTLICCDGSYFKALTKKATIEKWVSYPIPTQWSGYTAFYCPGYRSLFYAPANQAKIDLALRGVAAFRGGNASIFEDSIVESATYAVRMEDKKRELRDLLKYPVLTFDIETYSLQVDQAGLGTCAFAWDKHNGVAFQIDYCADDAHANVMRGWLKEFLIAYVAQGGHLIYHGGTYDIKVLIWELFMIDGSDITGMLEGLEVMFTLFDDTKTLAYLALNSCAGNSLGLKELAFAFTGNYGIDIKNITDYTLLEVMEYNLMDACATWYVYEQYRDIVRQEQEDVYQMVFRPSLKTITQMELTGLPMNLGEILNAENQLTDIRNNAVDEMRQSPIIQKFTTLLRELEVEKANNKLKKLRKTTDDFLHLEFNPNSNQQLSLLLFQELDLPVVRKTPKGNPSTDAETLDSLLERETRAKQPNQAIIDLLHAFKAFGEVDILLNTFIPAFKNKSVDKGGWRYLLGNFNLGGTKSGRMSSSDPNLHNIPSTGTKFAKTIKKCFQAPPFIAGNGDPYGWLFVGADYLSLEDRISALLTKDPNKLAVYIDGYDGHCLRAFRYFNKQMPDVAQEVKSAKRASERVRIINSIKHRYPSLRQDSKGPTFAMTYMGTWRTLMKTFGFSKEEAVSIERQYHELYCVSDEWVRKEIDKAGICGYVELAFGLRLRTPMLPKVILSSYDTLPFEAYQEVKTAANALGQSYGLLNNYSSNGFMGEVWAHKKYAEWILPVCHIHDGQYYMIRNHLGCIKWVNDHLIKWMEWAELEPIKHPKVGLGAELEVYYPDWNQPITLPNNASLRQIKETLNGNK